MKKSLICLSSVLLLALIGCKDRERQYTYYDRKKEKTKEVFEVDVETGKKDGKYKSFYRDGQLKIKTSYKNGEKEGSYEEYYENGQLKIETTYKNNEVCGEFKIYDDSGKLQAEGESPFPESKKGVMKDPRDGQTYKTVKIGKQVWMAENMNYDIKHSYCYENDPANCEKYGRLYKWNAALNVCPEGWHLPTVEEFETLISNVGGKAIAGKMLKSMIGWGENANGVDAFGFSVLPAGYRRDYDSFSSVGQDAKFWSATGSGENYAYYLSMDYFYEEARLILYYKAGALSVRCLRGSN